MAMVENYPAAAFFFGVRFSLTMDSTADVAFSTSSMVL
jgi:hypothetical protein